MGKSPASKTALVVPYKFAPPVNGGHKAAYGFAEFLSQELDFVCISSHNNANEDLPFSLIKCFKDKIFKYISPFVAWKIRKTLIREKVSSLILFQPFMGILLIPVALSIGLKWGVYIQNLEYQRFRSMGKWWWRGMYLLEKFVYHYADFLFFISPDDLKAAKKIFHLNSKKCKTVPFGTYLTQAPKENPALTEVIKQRHGIAKEDFVILFFGPQNYQPNLEAVLRIVNEIKPNLAKKAPFSFQFLICGGGLPKKYKHIKSLSKQGIQYLGYVKEIEAYIQAADLIINPINTGGGVKTKVIEAIALGKTVISSKTGAIGVDSAACQNKLLQVEDEDYPGWSKAIIEFQSKSIQTTPASFYDTYYWGNAVKNALISLSS